MIVLYFDKERYNDFLNLIILAQERRYNANNLFRKNEIYYKSQNEINIIKNEINVVEASEK